MRPIELSDTPSRPHDGAVVRWRFTDRSAGDLSPTGNRRDVDRRRAAVATGTWTWLRQVHGPDVVTVARPGEHAGRAADAAVTAVPGAVLAVTTADCAPVLVDGVVGTDEPTARRPVVAAAHAGWQGLEAGVLAATVDALGALGADRLRYRLGPCICPGHYEFGREPLERLERRFGPSVCASTQWGTPAFDLRAGVRSELAALGVEVAADEQPVPCTAGDPDRYWSWRARRDGARQAGVIWIEAEGAA